MGKDQTTAADHPSTNDLDQVYDPDAAKPPAYLLLGSTPLAFENPPQPGDSMTLVIDVRCTGFAGKEQADGKFVHRRSMKVTRAWRQGATPPPDPTEEQPAMIDENGDVTAGTATVTDSAPPSGADADAEVEQDNTPATEADADGIAKLAEVIDGNPAFSHAAVKASNRVRDKAKADAADLADAAKGDDTNE